MRLTDALKNSKEGTKGKKQAVVIAAAVLAVVEAVLLVAVLAPSGMLETLAQGGSSEFPVETEGGSLETEEMIISDTQDEVTEVTEAAEVTEDEQVQTEDDMQSGDSDTETVSEASSPYDLTDVIEVPDVEYPYYIKVNRQANCVTVYTLDENGQYTVPIKAMVCSVGLNNATPLGVYTTSDKYEWRALYGNVYGQYAYRINGSIMFHSVPYYTTNKDDLETEEYNKLGEAASMGCIRLSCADAKWLVDNCPSGTTVEIYDDEDPGPLGKPAAIKIDTDSPYAGWDPTDPDPDNPWNSDDENDSEAEDESGAGSESQSESEPASEAQSETAESEAETESQSVSEPVSEAQGEAAESESETEAQSESEPVSEVQSETAESEAQPESDSEEATEDEAPVISLKSDSVIITISEEDIRSSLLENLEYEDQSSYRVILSYSDLTEAVNLRRFGTYTCTAYIRDINTGKTSETVSFTVKYVPNSSYADSFN